MFGIMQRLNITICANAEEAIDKGYSKEELYKDAEPVDIAQVVIVHNGTQGGNSTVDLLLEDQNGNKFVVMVTGNLLKSLPV